MTFKFIDTSSNGLLVVDWLDFNAACLAHHSCILVGDRPRTKAMLRTNKIRENIIFSMILLLFPG